MTARELNITVEAPNETIKKEVAGNILNRKSGNFPGRQWGVPYGKEHSGDEQ